MSQTQLSLQAPHEGSDAEVSLTCSADPNHKVHATKCGSGMPIRILVVDDHPFVRKGLSSCLSNYRQVSIAGEAGDGPEALLKVRELAPDLVLMDIDMPGMNGLTVTDALRRQNPKVKVMVLSMHSDSDNVLRVLQSGARGFVLKHSPTSDLIKAIEIISSGETFFSPDVTHVCVNQLVRGGGERSQAAHLSNREREVIIAIAEGLSNKEIASRLGVTLRTIQTYRKCIMAKLNIHGVAGLTKFAIASGWVRMQKNSGGGGALEPNGIE